MLLEATRLESFKSSYFFCGSWILRANRIRRLQSGSYLLVLEVQKNNEKIASLANGRSLRRTKLYFSVGMHYKKTDEKLKYGIWI